MMEINSIDALQKEIDGLILQLNSMNDSNLTVEMADAQRAALKEHIRILILQKEELQ